jgi:ketosteroid isomerase-like protein
MAANRKEIVQRINDGFAENNLERVLSFCTDDLTWTMVGETTVTGKDPIRKWMASMAPQPPRFTIQHIVAEGDLVITRGDMTMPERKDGPSIPYSFCDFYRFQGDKVAELTAFVIRTDKPRTATHESTERESVEHG